MAIGDGAGLVSIYTNSSSYLSLVQSFQAHSSAINRIKQSPFNNLSSNSNYVATCSDDSTVKIWNIASLSSTSNWTLLRTYSNNSDNIYAMDWIEADTLASSEYRDQIIKIWSVSSGQTKREILTNSDVFSLKLLSSFSYLAAGLRTDINIYSLNDGSLFSTLKGHTYYVWDLVQLNSNTLASASSDQTVRIWDLGTNKLKFTLLGHTSIVFSLKQITSTILASGSQDETIRLWDTINGQLIRILTGHAAGIKWSMYLMDNGQTLVSGSVVGSIHKWNWSTGELLSTMYTDVSFIYSLDVIDLSNN